MQIFIDNTEVVCSRSFNIKKSLSNANSVILNNVYPKSWENDRDYVSNFYMAKDYSKCKIIDENLAKNKIIKEETSYISNLYANDSTLKITRITDSRLRYIPVIPNETYKLKLTSTVNTYIYSSTGFYENDNITRLAEVEIGDNSITITPTSNYIVFTEIDENLNIITSNYEVEILTNKNIVELKDNITLSKNRLLRFNDNKILYSNTYNVYYMQVVPNHTYLFKVSNSSGTRYICETNSLKLDTTTNRVAYMGLTGSAYFSVIPTCKYLVWSSSMDITTIKVICNSDLLFGGIVKNSGNINLNPRYPHYSTLQVLDYSTLLSEGDVLNYVLDRQTVLSALQKLVDGLDGFMLGTLAIDLTEEIGPYNCSEKTPHDVLEYIAEITGSIWFAQTISEDITLINFYMVDNLNKQNNIEYTQEYFDENKILDIQYTYNTNDYRNKQVITSTDVQSSMPQVEFLSYNETSLKTAYPISSIISITKGNRSYSVAQDMAEVNGTHADFYYSYGNNEITTNNDFLSGSIFKVEYYSIVTCRQVAYNQTEVDRIGEQTNRNGIISRYEKRTDTANETTLSKIAQTYLDFKGVPEIIITIKSYENNLFNLGDVVFFNGPLEDLQTNYLVTEINVDMIITGTQEVVFYSYKLSSSFNDENAINFFDNQRRKLMGDIQEGKYAPRYVDIPSSTNIIFYGLEFTEEEIPSNILDGELDMEI